MRTLWGTDNKIVLEGIMNPLPKSNFLAYCGCGRLITVAVDKKSFLDELVQCYTKCPFCANEICFKLTSEGCFLDEEWLDKQMKDIRSMNEQELKERGQTGWHQTQEINGLYLITKEEETYRCSGWGYGRLVPGDILLCDSYGGDYFCNYLVLDVTEFSNALPRAKKVAEIGSYSIGTYIGNIDKNKANQLKSGERISLDIDLSSYKRDLLWGNLRGRKDSIIARQRSEIVNLKMRVDDLLLCLSLYDKIKVTGLAAKYVRNLKNKIQTYRNRHISIKE
jgi:hypothetical protein